MLRIEQREDQAERAARVKGKGKEPCYICGRAINILGTNYFWIEVGKGGTHALKREDVDGEAPDYMGCFPVGPDCVKKQPGLAEYAIQATGPAEDAEALRRAGGVEGAAVEG
ncbi:MAG TPA: hypothetical protein VGB98_25755 [Pyrinomonadaceae bacterium]|jgi:hypothetical protein